LERLHRDDHELAVHGHYELLVVLAASPRGPPTLKRVLNQAQLVRGKIGVSGVLLLVLLHPELRSARLSHHLLEVWRAPHNIAGLQAIRVVAI